jgi:Domain of unknown function (DUF4836)
MNSIKPFNFLLIATTLFLTACSYSKLPDDSLKNVPADVTSVTAFNLNQMMAKADYDYIKNLEFFKAGLDEFQKDKPGFAGILENPFHSGVDLTKNAYFVMEMNKNLPEDMQFGALVFSVNDKVLFQQMAEKATNLKTTDRQHFRFINNDKGGIIAWNDHFGMLAGGSPTVDMEDYILSYFDQKRKTSVADNPDLAICFSKDYDIATWFNSNVLADNPQFRTAASLMGLSKSALKDNYFHSYIHFEEGLVKAESKHMLKKELTNDLKLFFKKGVRQDLSRYIPAESLGLAFSMALDPKGIYQIISEKTGGVNTMNAGLKKFGFSSKDLAEAFGGDLVFAVYNNPASGTTTDAKPGGLLTGTIGDKKLFQQFLDLGVQLEMLTANGDNSFRIKSDSNSLDKAYLLVKEDVFFITNQKTILDKLQAGGYTASEKIPGDLYEALANNAFGAVMDFEQMESMKKDFEKLPFDSGHLNMGLKSSSLQLTLKNKEVNSLKAFFEMMNQLYLNNKSETAKEAITEAEI